MSEEVYKWPDWDDVPESYCFAVAFHGEGAWPGTFCTGKEQAIQFLLSQLSSDGWGRFDILEQLSDYGNWSHCEDGSPHQCRFDVGEISHVTITVMEAKLFTFCPKSLDRQPQELTND